jgi:WD40 repeat protein
MRSTLIESLHYHNLMSNCRCVSPLIGGRQFASAIHNQSSVHQGRSLGVRWSGFLLSLACLFSVTSGCIVHQKTSSSANPQKPGPVQVSAGDVLAQSSDGKLILRCVSSKNFESVANFTNNNRAAVLVDARTGEIKAYFDATSGPVLGAAFVDRKKLCILAVSDWGTVPRVFDMVTGKERTQFKGGLQMWLCAVAVSPDEHFVVSGGGDMSICLWDLDDPSYFRELHRDVAGNDPTTRDPIWRVAFSKNGRAIEWITKSGRQQHLDLNGVSKEKAKSAP